jgi:hypothetical protein
MLHTLLYPPTIHLMLSSCSSHALSVCASTNLQCLSGGKGVFRVDLGKYFTSNLPTVNSVTSILMHEARTAILRARSNSTVSCAMSYTYMCKTLYSRSLLLRHLVLFSDFFASHSERSSSSSMLVYICTQNS